MNKITITAAGILLACVSAAAGFVTAPEDYRIPVLLSNGEVITQPCYVEVDGQSIALVKDEQEAKKAVDNVKKEYENDDTVEVEIVEDTSVKNASIKNGDKKPRILTAKEAARQILKADSLTVETVEVIETEERIEYDTVEKSSSELHTGETIVSQQGEDGICKVTTEVSKENGEVISSKVISEETVKEPVSQIVIQGTRGVAEPLDTLRVTSGFGPRWGRSHTGIDLGSNQGTPIYAADDGVVICAEYCGSYGNLVRVDHGDGIETYYAHCSSLDVSEGEYVNVGDIIARVGSTGNSTGPHLHFEVRVNGVPQNPVGWLPEDSIIW